MKTAIHRDTHVDLVRQSDILHKRKVAGSSLRGHRVRFSAGVGKPVVGEKTSESEYILFAWHVSITKNGLRLRKRNMKKKGHGTHLITSTIRAHWFLRRAGAPTARFHHNQPGQEVSERTFATYRLLPGTEPYDGPGYTAHISIFVTD